jgi:hypothetical protein
MDETIKEPIDGNEMGAGIKTIHAQGAWTLGERILPEYEHFGQEQLREIIAMALGNASVCWDPMDCTGVFESERAGQLVHELLEFVWQFAHLFLVTHDDRTMQKVYKALMDAGLTPQQIVNAVFAMQNSGVLFREVSPHVGR